MLSKNQVELINKIYNNNKFENESIDDFCMRLINCCFNEIKTIDIKNLLMIVNKDVLLTKAQLKYVLEISEYLGVALDHITTQDHLQKLEKTFDLFFPKKIHYTKKYHCKYKTIDYMILEQFSNDNIKELDLVLFNNILICDWDHIELNEIKQLLLKFPELSFRIYKTNKGYHGYCTNKLFDHYQFSTHQLMYKLQCDPWYISFCKLYGFIVRISPKLNRVDDIIEKYIETFPNTFRDNSSIIDLIHNKDLLITTTTNTINTIN
jgi:hypothetical protein